MDVDARRPTPNRLGLTCRRSAALARALVRLGMFVELAGELGMLVKLAGEIAALGDSLSGSVIRALLAASVMLKQ